MKKIFSLVLLLLLSLSLFANDVTFALVLSGGGAKGIAEIPILKELDRRGLYPDYVVGTSVGSLVGAFYAAGYSGEEIESLLRSEDLMALFTNIYSRSGKSLMMGGSETPKTNLFSLDFSSKDLGASNGIIDDERVSRFFRVNLIRALNTHDFDKLSIPFRCTGTDAETGEGIIFSYGSLYNAMRSSMAIPVVFAPGLSDNGRYVLDGGLVDNLPVDIAKELGADIVLAVDLNDVYRTHIEEGESPNDLDTLSGMLFQLFDLVTAPNAKEQYEQADFMIIPNLHEIGTLDFGRTEEILQIGEDAVKENMAFFDELEERVGKRERPLSYSERETFVVKSIVYPNLQHYKTLLESFVGREMDEEAADEFEDVLSYIKRQEGLKSVNYDVIEGVVVIRTDEFSSLSSSVSAGLGLDMGLKMRLDGSESLFYFSPDLSIVLNFPLPDDYGEIVAGINLSSYTSAFAYYFYPLGSSFSLISSVRAGVGDISMLSISDRIDRLGTSDFLFSLEAGAAYDYFDYLRLELTLDFDVISLGSLKSYDNLSNDMDRMLFFDPMLNFNLKYRTIDRVSFINSGLDIDLDMGIYLKAPLMYFFSLSFESTIATPIPSGSFYINGEATSLRSNEYIGRSYRVNKGGSITRDYVMLEAGGRIVLARSNFFMLLGLYAEGFETRSYETRFWEIGDDYNLIPFSMINDYAIGASIYLGYRFDFGDLLFGLDVSFNGDVSIGVKLR